MIRLYKGTSVMSWMIRKWTHGTYSHVAWVCEDGTLVEASMTGGVTAIPASMDTREYDEFMIPLSGAQQFLIDLRMKSYVGEKYDFKAIFGMVFHIKAQNPMAWFCSELVVGVLNDSGIYPLRKLQSWQVSPEWLSWSPILKEMK